MFGKDRIDKFEVYNDSNRDLVNLFQVIRDKPLDLLVELRLYPLNARDDFNCLTAYLRHDELYESTFQANLKRQLELTEIILPGPKASELKELLLHRAELGDVRRAAMFLKVLRTSYASTGRSFGGQPFSMDGLNRLIIQASKRLREVVIENLDFEQLILRNDRKDTFIYCDPPYVESEHFYGIFTW